MKRVYQISEVLASGKEVYVGIEVHKESFHVTAIAEGEEVFNGGMPSRYEVLKKLLARFEDCRVKVAYEAGPSGFWLSDKLKTDGIDTIVVPPSLIPVESGNRVKTDKRDSRKSARLLEGGCHNHHCPSYPEGGLPYHQVWRSIQRSGRRVPDLSENCFPRRAPAG